MRTIRFDWRWAALIAFVAILANARSLPWFITVLAFGLSGGYLLRLAWQAWGPGTNDTRRVTYWRGERIETRGSSRRPRPRSWDELAPVVVYALLGTALALGAVAVTLRALAPSLL